MMLTVKQFEELASQAATKLITSPYRFEMSEESIYSPRYYDCVGVAIAGKRLWALSHYDRPGTSFTIPDTSEPMARFAGSEEVERLIEKREIYCTCPEPIEYLRTMKEFLTKYAINREKETDLVAIPFAGDGSHLSKVVEALENLGIQQKDPVKLHFSDTELGGAEGRILCMPASRIILHHSVSRSRIVEMHI
jgi:hypothetical protein